jgi:hypothetical protein
MAIDEMALVIHSSFNRTTHAILNYEDDVEETLFASEGEPFSLWNSTLFKDSSTNGWYRMDIITLII